MRNLSTDSVLSETLQITPDIPSSVALVGLPIRIVYLNSAGRDTLTAETGKNLEFERAGSLAGVPAWRWLIPHCTILRVWRCAL